MNSMPTLKYLFAGILVVACAGIMVASWIVFHSALKRQALRDATMAADKAGTEIIMGLDHQGMAGKILADSLKAQLVKDHVDSESLMMAAAAVKPMAGGDHFLTGWTVWLEPGIWQPPFEGGSLSSNGTLAGRVVSSHGESGHEKWYDVLRASGGDESLFWVTPESPLSDGTALVLALPVFKNKRFAGAVTVGFSVMGVRSLVAEVVSRLEGYAFVLDGRNRFVAFTEEGGKQRDLPFSPGMKANPHAALLEKMGALFPDQVENHEKTGMVTAGDESGIGQFSFDAIAALKAGTVIFDDPLLRKRGSLTLFHMPSKVWQVGVVIPLEHSFATVGWPLITGFLSFLLLTLFFFLFIGYTMNRKLFAPLEEILSQLDSSQEAPLRRIEPLFRSEREWDRLVSGLNHRVEQVAKLQAALSEKGEQLDRTEALLAKTRKEADAAISARSDFLANMSHEIRTPLNGVIAAADLALSEEITERGRHFLGMIHESGCKLMGIIEDLFDFSRIESGRLELNNAPFLLDDVVDSVVSTFMYNAHEREIEFLVDIDSETPLTLLGDRFKIQHVLSNLLSNAFKFTDQFGMIVLGVRDSGKLDESHRVELEFYVQDTGLGMRSDQVNQLFQPFIQADTSTTRKYGGTGLGLSICKQLVEKMGGTIHVESEYGRGTTVSFTIVIEKMASPRERDREVTSGIGALNVVIADDNRVSLALLEKIIRSFGFKGVTASSGREVLEILKRGAETGKTFDLVLLDWRMPGLDGVETAKKIKGELGLNLPVLVMSAFGGSRELKEMADGSVTGFLKKPFYASTLFDAIVEIFADRISVSGLDGRELVTYDAICMERINGMKVLVVDDNPSNRMIAKAMLEKANVRVTLAENGKEAVEAVKNDQVNAVLMDLQMPEMDGYEATRRIRALPEYAGLSIIAMTANALKGDEERCINAGMNGYLNKPVRQDRLFRTLCKRVMYRRSAESIQKKREQPVSRVETLPASLPGLNLAGALRALKIESDTFLNILVGFMRSNRETSRKIRGAFEQGRWEEIKKIAHGIKGSSGAIGAGELSDISARIESDCEKAGGPHEEMIDLFEKKMETVVASIRSLEEEKGEEPGSGVVEDEARGAGEKVDTGELKRALEASNPGEIERALLRLGNSLDENTIRELGEHIANYDYDEALKTLNLLSGEGFGNNKSHRVERR